MRKAFSALLAVCLILGVFTACAAPAPKANYDLEALSSKISDSAAFSDILSPVNPEIAASFFGYDAADISECKVLCSTGATTEEISLFKCSDEAAAERVLGFAKKRAESQKTAYQSYAPDEVPKIDNAIIRSEGVYVFYIVSTDSTKVEAAISGK
ncbi:MAG: DUF4358 domain-containing protein [Oscillospiraceae bacterium]